MELDTFTDNVGVYGCEGYGPWSLEGRSPFTVSLVSGGPVPEGEGYYEAVLAKLALDEETVEIDEPIAISGRLDVARDSDTWLFDAGPDELLSVQITGMGAGACPDELWPLVVAVTDANGEVMDIGSSDNAGVYGCDAYGPFTLDGDAPYALTFTSNGPVLEGQGEYEATLALVG